MEENITIMKEGRTFWREIGCEKKIKRELLEYPCREDVKVNCCSSMCV